MNTFCTKIIDSIIKNDSITFHSLLLNCTNINYIRVIEREWSLLFYATFYKRLDMAKVLIDHGVDFSYCRITQNNVSTFHNCAYMCMPGMDASILLNNIMTYISNKWYFTPLHEAVSENNIQDVEELLKKNSCPNIRDNDGWTPVHIAIYFNRANILKLLLNNDGSLIIQNNKNMNAYHIAFSIGNKEIIDILFDRIYNK